jgi:hypothetical protein
MKKIIKIITIIFMIIALLRIKFKLYLYILRNPSKKTQQKTSHELIKINYPIANKNIVLINSIFQKEDK